jgi:3D (Asp-Asp-Asp) domain-containing protein
MRSLIIQVVRMINKIIGYLLLVLSLTFSVHSYASSFKKLNVTATAYNSVSAQTDSTPNIAAWGDRLKPGMKAIAVSRDLLKMGLKRGSKVKISGLPGEYVVLDKMHHRWSRKIDIYMGKNVRAAKNWGKRRVTITVVKT